jgi:tetratricopeptide (TPR) repeat protein
MRWPRELALGRCGALAAFMCLLLSQVPWADADPFVPARDEQVIERLPVAAGPSGLELRDAVTAASGDPNVALRLARSYIRFGQEESDPRYFGYAEGILSTWWQKFAPNVDALLLRAIIRQDRHDFEGALLDLKTVLQMQPGNNQAWLTYAAISKLLGRFDDARDSCAVLAQATEPLVAITCLCEVNSLTGSAPESFDVLRQLLDHRKTVSAEQRRWTLTVLAEIAARLDRNVDAEAFFKSALAIMKPSAYLLGVYADFLIDQDRPDDAVAILGETTRIDSLLLRLALARRLLGSADLDDLRKIIAERFAESRRRGENVHLGDEARFALYLQSKPERALQLARENWKSRHAPQDARVLLEAASAAGDESSEREAAAFLTQTGMADAQLARLSAKAKNPVGR